MATNATPQAFPPLIRNPGGLGILDVDAQEVIGHCKQSGAALLFGYRATLQEFEQFTNRICTDWQTYRGGAHEKEILNSGSDSTIYSVNLYFGRKKQLAVPLPLHSEMSYMKNRPAIVCFYAIHPAETRGETTICDGVEFYRSLTESSRRFLDSNRIVYIRETAPAFRMQRFYTEEFPEAERFCRQNEMTISEKADGIWETRFVVSPVRETLFSDEPAFSNSILIVLEQEDRGLTGSCVRLEDGSEIPPEIIGDIRDVAERKTRLIQWEQPGDFALMDNSRVLHGRNGFDDLDRNIAQRLGRSVPW